MDLELSIFDTSGQELSFILENETERDKAFKGADVIIYTMDYLWWISQSGEIIEEITMILNLIERYKIEAKFFVLFHKVDLINQKLKHNFKNIKNIIKNNVDILMDLNIYFTSLHPSFIHRTFNAFFEILSNISVKTLNIKNAIDSILEKFSRISCFITNQSNHIVVQSMTRDFDSRLIHLLHKYIANIDHTTEQLEEIYNQMFLIDISNNVLSMILVNLESMSSELKNLIIFSEIYDIKELNTFIDSIKSKIHFIKN
jgi:hypothetical protein